MSAAISLDELLGTELPLIQAPMAGAQGSALASAVCNGGLGSGDFSPLWCGQDASGCREVPAAVLTRALAQGFSEGS